MMMRGGDTRIMALSVSHAWWLGQTSGSGTGLIRIRFDFQTDGVDGLADEAGGVAHGTV